MMTMFLYFFKAIRLNGQELGCYVDESLRFPVDTSLSQVNMPVHIYSWVDGHKLNVDKVSCPITQQIISRIHSEI